MTRSADPHLPPSRPVPSAPAASPAPPAKQRRPRLALAAGATAVLAAYACGGKTASGPTTLREVRPSELRSVADFASVADRTERSQLLFLEASKVILHPRCANCHPAGDSPLQRQFELHDPPVTRGPADEGVVGMECTTCHQESNQDHTRVPGAPKWHLAPIEMAWVGKTPRQICEQVKDPARNGQKSLAEIVEHSAHDKLVAWGWSPGADRQPAPGTQQQFGALMAAWVETGAACPEEVAR
jgi:hypothetical protein